MREYHVLNLGAGVQSAVLYLMAREADAPFRFDVAIFADTQEEPLAVRQHLEYLQGLGHPPIWVRTAGKLGDDLMHGRNSTGQGFASIPAFTAPNHLERWNPCDMRPQPAPKYEPYFWSAFMPRPISVKMALATLAPRKVTSRRSAPATLSATSRTGDAFVRRVSCRQSWGLSSPTTTTSCGSSGSGVSRPSR